MRINSAVLTVLCAALLFVPASRDVETTMTMTMSTAGAPAWTFDASMDAACARAAADPDALSAMLADLSAAAQGGPNPPLCVDTIECGGCCGNQHQVTNFLRCCARGDGFACSQRFGCR